MSLKHKLRTVVYFVSPYCNSRCKTCNIWKKSLEREENPSQSEKPLSHDEWLKVFESVGKIPWVIFTGGEPFLLKDFKEFVIAAIRIQRPKAITIPTNGLLTEKIERDLNEILKQNKSTKIYVNVSLDGFGELNDYIRGVNGSFNQVILTLKSLTKLKRKNRLLKIAVNTVISRYNIERIMDFKQTFRDFVRQEKIVLDNHLFEPAKYKQELSFPKQLVLDTPFKENSFLVDDIELTPILQTLYKKELVDFFKMKDPLRTFLRLRYYKRIVKYLKTGRLNKCSAGRRFVEISPTGDVWNCGVLCLSFGNLRDENFDFYNVFNSRAAQEIREKTKNCKCTLLATHYL